MWTEITRPKYEREGLGYSDLSDAEWAMIEPRLPQRRRLGRPPKVAPDETLAVDVDEFDKRLLLPFGVQRSAALHPCPSARPGVARGRAAAREGLPTISKRKIALGRYPDLLIALAPPFALHVPVSPLGCQRSAVLQPCPSARPGVR